MAITISVKQLLEGNLIESIPKRYRNRRIGDFLKELKLTEGKNSYVT